jgi:hypothetical protein
MVDQRALQAAYKDAVAMGNRKLASELLALWRDTLPERVAKHSQSRRDRSEGSGRLRPTDLGGRFGAIAVTR